MHDNRLAGVDFDQDDVASLDSIDVFPHQVGGHHVIVKHPTRPDLIVKPFLAKETQFYQDAQKDSRLQEVISKYYGRIHLSGYGALEDLTYGMEEPCVMDMKIGRRLHDDDATPEKAERMMKKSASSTSGSVGFRISGMRSLDSRDGKVIIRMKNDMRGLKKEELLPTMESFFAQLSTAQSRTLIGHFLQRLKKIKAAVLGSNSRFYSSSILFVYDHANQSHWDCRMIDFVHSHIFPPKDQIVDSNYLDGLANLAEYLQMMSERYGAAEAEPSE